MFYKWWKSYTFNVCPSRSKCIIQTTVLFIINLTYLFIVDLMFVIQMFSTHNQKLKPKQGKVLDQIPWSQD